MTTLKEVMNDMIEEKSKIMVVDDDHEIREVISVLLSNEDFDIIEAESGEEALKLLAANIDLIILDVMMPGMSGYQVSSNDSRAVKCANFISNCENSKF